ncbi:MAG: zinc ribbon domain-containing protein [Xanthobacteraceae bacterium]
MPQKIASPVVTVETQPFWNAAREGRFVVPVCTACGRVHWYPRAICPFCDSEKVEWRPASGRGTIYTFSVMRRVKQAYAIAHVTLAEGPTMLTNIIDCDFDKLSICQAVAVVYKESENGQPVPMFAPA